MPRTLDFIHGSGAYPLCCRRADLRKDLRTDRRRTCGQVVEQVLEVPKNSSQDRDLHGTVEQILDVLVPEMAKQLVEVPETISPDRIQQRTVEQIVDASVPQAEEELADVFRVSPRTGFNSALLSRSFLLFYSLRRSLSYSSFRRDRV